MRAKKNKYRFYECVASRRGPHNRQDYDLIGAFESAPKELSFFQIGDLWDAYRYRIFDRGPEHIPRISSTYIRGD